MSKVKIEGNASGTGTLTISAPNTNTDRSLTLPDTAGEVVLKTSTGIDTNNNITIERSSDATKYSVIGMETGNLNFNTYNGNQTFSNSGTEAMRIDSSGNVGIGTSSPFGTASGRTVLSLNNSSDNRIGFGVSGTERQYIYGDSTNLSIINTQSGYMRFNTNNTERMRINNIGDLLVGVSSFSGSTSGKKISVSDNAILESSRGSTSSSSHVRFWNPNGNVGSITTSSTSTSYNTSSDYRLKENVVDMDGAIDRVKALQPRRFNFIADEDDTTVDGFIAHEVSDVVPEAISGEKDATREEEYEVTPAVLDDNGNVTTEAVMGTRTVPDYQGIDQSKLVPLLTGALQEAIAKIEALETRIEALENA